MSRFTGPSPAHELLLRYRNSKILGNGTLGIWHWFRKPHSEETTYHDLPQVVTRCGSRG
jgi:hypothetical protein